MVLGALAIGIASIARATPVIPADSVSVSQNAGRVVTVTYTLGDENNQESAIVTVDFETNVTGTVEGPWVSIGERNFRNVNGFVNKVVEPGTHTIIWAPRETWPDRVIQGGNFRAKVKAWAKTCPPDYLAIDLVAPMRYYYTSTNALPFDIGDDICRKDILLMRKIPAAGVEWRMGAPDGEKGKGVNNRYTAMETTHYVTLSSDYYFGVFLITRWQYARIMGDSAIASLQKPCQAVTGMSYDLVRYAGQTTAASGNVWPTDKSVNSGSMLYRLRQMSGIDTFDLPTSAQWEFACRAGTSSALYTGLELASSDPNALDSEDTNLNDIAWYRFNTGGVCPDRVGTKLPNGWGLYDLYGTVYEWCLDFARTAWSTNELDPEGPVSGTQRFQVGGVNNDCPARCRSAFRMGRDPSSAYPGAEIFGVRVVCGVAAP